MKLASILKQSNGNFSNKQRLKDLLDIINMDNSDLFLFPAGYFYSKYNSAEAVCKDVEEKISPYLRDKVVCTGIDGFFKKPQAEEQIALAINNKGIAAYARKFHPTKTESINRAKSFLELEQGFQRILEFGGIKFYLAICYDSFGIRQKNIQNPEVDVILNLIHGFFPFGEKNCGENYFVRHGLAGASKQWKCPVYASTTFFNRKIPINFPSGVLWN